MRSVRQLSSKTLGASKRLYSTESKPTVAVFGADAYNPLPYHVVQQLLPKANVRIQTNNINDVKRGFEKRDIDISKVEFIEGDSTNEYSVESTVYGADSVVNLDRLYIEGERSYLDVYVAGPRNIGTMADKYNVKSFIQTSVIGADLDHESRFLDLNFRAEDMAYGAFPNVTIVRPCFVTFGDKQAIVELFKTRKPLQLSPVIPYPISATQVMVQPVHVKDVAAGITKVALEQDMSGKIIEMGGGKTLPFGPLLKKMFGSRIILPIPDSFTHVIYGVTQFLPGAVISRDQVAMVCPSMLDDNGSNSSVQMTALGNPVIDPTQAARYATFKDLSIEPIPFQ